MAINIQLRRGLSSLWTSTNPLLLQGELGIETDTTRFKLGDGINHWNTLPYGGPEGVMPASLIAELAWSDQNPSNYTHLTYSGGQLTHVDVYTDSSMTTHLFSKVYAYTSGVLTSVSITVIATGSTIVKTIGYTGGVVTSVTRAYTP